MTVRWWPILARGKTDRGNYILVLVAPCGQRAQCHNHALPRYAWNLDSTAMDSFGGPTMLLLLLGSSLLPLPPLFSGFSTPSTFAFFLALIPPLATHLLRICSAHFYTVCLYFSIPDRPFSASLNFPSHRSRYTFM
jgi:hypothetical protein